MSAINGLAPIHMAASKCSQEIVIELIRHGADPLKRMDDGTTAYDIAHDKCPDLIII
jgi:ankyrin repeat protein